jgi:glycerophosphoryl diester phosphodiesterase
LVSDNWTKQFKWDGVGAIPEDEKQKLHDFVAAVHEQRRRVRFWGTPDDPERRQAVWRALIEAGVDYINTDDLAGLSAFLQGQDAQASEPAVDWFGGLGELVQRSAD